MIHPHIDLDLITKELQELGFVPVTKMLFRRELVDIEIKDGIVPDGAADLCTPFFRVKIYGISAARYAQIDCDLLQLLIVCNSGE